MKSSLKTRVPLFELSLLLVLVAMGWALMEVNRISKQQISFETRFRKDIKDQEAAFQDQLEQARTMSWKQHLLNQSNVFKSFIEMELSRKLREAYLTLAIRLETDLPEIHQAVVRYSGQTNWNDLVFYDQKSQELSTWLRGQEVRFESEPLVARSQELVTNGAKSVSMDLRTVCREVQSGLTSYTNKAALICTVARNLSEANPHNFSAELGIAAEQIRRMLDLAAGARRDAATVEAMPLALTELPAEFTHQLNKAQQAGLISPSLSPENDYSERLQAISYAMLAAMFGLAFILVSAVYRRVVVDKLRYRLHESATQSKLASLSQLAAWLAHEIKQPLTAVNAWLWTLQKGIKDGTPEFMGMTSIRKEIGRLDQIVKDFLRYTQPSAPKLGPLRAEPLFQEVLNLLGPQLACQRIQMTLDSMVKTRFSADPQQLKQVLINLVTNAAESIEHDGKITLRARRDKAPLRGQTAEVIVLEVEDTGPGIPADVQQRLFDPFFSTKEEGTGLGLPIAANIIEKHGGALEFKTGVGKGTTFAIVLPIFQEAA